MAAAKGTLIGCSTTLRRDRLRTLSMKMYRGTPTSAKGSCRPRSGAPRRNSFRRPSDPGLRSRLRVSAPASPSCQWTSGPVPLDVSSTYRLRERAELLAQPDDQGLFVATSLRPSIVVIVVWDQGQPAVRSSQGLLGSFTSVTAFAAVEVSSASSSCVVRHVVVMKKTVGYWRRSYWYGKYGSNLRRDHSEPQDTKGWNVSLLAALVT